MEEKITCECGKKEALSKARMDSEGNWHCEKCVQSFKQDKPTDKKHRDFMELVSPEKSTLLQKLEWEAKNQAWLDLSAKISMRLLDLIDESGMEKSEICMKLNISATYYHRLLKGRENFTLETITKLERLFKTKLIGVYGFEKEKKQIIKPNKVWKRK